MLKIAFDYDRIFILKTEKEVRFATESRYMIMDGSKIVEVYQLLGRPLVSYWSNPKPIVKMGEQAFEYDWLILHKNAKANPNLYGGRWTKATERKAFIKEQFENLVKGE